MVTQTLKSLPSTWETWIQSLGHENPLEKEMATLSSILAWPKSLEGLLTVGWQKSWTQLSN